MDFALAVKNRDALVRASIRTAIGRANLSDEQKNDLAKTARAAFNQGIQEWEEKYLEIAVGPEEAKRIRAIFRNEPG